jgi:hypothetical protein
VLNSALADQIRRGQAVIEDIDAAYGLTQLAHEELLEYGTQGNTRLKEDEITAVLRALRTVLNRLGVPFDPPFRNFAGFHGYWSNPEGPRTLIIRTARQEDH